MDIVAIDNFFQEKYPGESLTNSLSKYWKGFYRGNTFIAGKFKSKGLKVYTAVWDVNKKAFYCNCSSLKNPCAHGIDLYFRFKHQYSEFEVVDPENNEYEELIAKAISVDKQRSDFYTKEDLDRMLESRTKQRTDRIELMKQGAKILENWIEDAFSMGLADLSLKQIEFWKELASTLVNYKLNALSDRVLDFAYRDRAELSDWYTQCIHFLSDLYLFSNAFTKIDQLPDLQESLLRGGGVKVMSKDLEKEQVEPIVAVLISIEQWHQNNLFYEKYLWINVETNALFYVQHSTWEGAYDRNKALPFKEGDQIKGEFVKYGYNQRFYLKEGYTKILEPGLVLANIQNSFESVFEAYRSMLSSQLVLNEYYFVFGCADLVKKENHYYLKDGNGKYMRVNLHKKDYFKLKYNRSKSTCLIIRLKQGDLDLFAYFDSVSNMRFVSKKPIMV